MKEKKKPFRFVHKKNYSNLELVLSVKLHVRFPRGSSDRHATIPAGPKCTLTLPLMARRCARRQSRRIDGTIFLERWYVRQNRRRHARAARSRRRGVPVCGVLSRGNVGTGNFHAPANSIFIYLLDVHNVVSHDCCSI